MKIVSLGISFLLVSLVLLLFVASRAQEGVGGDGSGGLAPASGAAVGMDAALTDFSAAGVVSERTVLREGGLPEAPSAAEGPVGFEVRVICRRSGLPIAQAVINRASVEDSRPEVGSILDGPWGQRRFAGSKFRAVTGSDGKATVEAKAHSNFTVEATGYVDGKFEVPAEWEAVEGGESEDGVASRQQLIVLNEHASLFGTIGGQGGPVPEGTSVIIEHQVEGQLQMAELRAPVQPDGTWLVDSIEIAHGEPFAEGLGVFVAQGPSLRLLGAGLTLQPGDRREVHDLAGSKPPWKLNVVYGDGSPMGPGAKVLLREVGVAKGSFLWASRTDAEGQVEVLGVGAGVFGVAISVGSQEFTGELRRASKAVEQDLVLEGYGRVAGRVRWNLERPIGGGSFRLIGLRDATFGEQPFRDGRFRFDLVPLGTRCQLVIPVLPSRAGGRWSGNIRSLGDPLLRPLTPAEASQLRSLRCRPFLKDVTPGLEDIEFQVVMPK